MGFFDLIHSGLAYGNSGLDRYGCSRSLCYAQAHHILYTSPTFAVSAGARAFMFSQCFSNDQACPPPLFLTKARLSLSGVAVSQGWLQRWVVF